MPRDDLAGRLLLALQRRDELLLANLLTSDVVLVVDTGDRSGGELRGRVRVIGALLDLRMPHPDAELEGAHVNGGPGLVVRALDGLVVGIRDRRGTGRSAGRRRFDRPALADDGTP